VGNCKFATTVSKSRLNFLEVLRAGFTDYVVNAEALAYMRRRSLAGSVIASRRSIPSTTSPTRRPGRPTWSGSASRR
jgi:hypothetical protein